MRQKILQTLKNFNRLQWLVLAAFLLVFGLTGYLSYHTIRRSIYWHYHQDEPIRGWMTVGYVAHSYKVPPHVLYEALGLPPRLHDRRPLKKIARDQNRSMDEIRTILQNAIADARPLNPPSPPPPKNGGKL